MPRREQTPPWGPAAWDPGHSTVSTQRAAAARGVCLSLSTHWDLPSPHADPGQLTSSYALGALNLQRLAKGGEGKGFEVTSGGAFFLGRV